MKTKSHLKLRALCEGAIMVALAQVLGYLKFFELPQGGSITIGMLPIFLYCARWGFGPGMLASIVYSVLQLLLDGAYAWGWQSMVGDYILAFSVLGLAGLFHKNHYGFYYGILVGGFARFLVHYLTGVFVWGEYMPETFFGMTMTTPWFYSATWFSTCCSARSLAGFCGSPSASTSAAKICRNKPPVCEFNVRKNPAV